MRKRLVQIAVLVAGVFTFLIPVSAQFGGIGDVIRDRAEREAREAVERELATALFPLEEEGAQIRRQAPQLDGIDFGSTSDMSTLARTPTGGFVLRPGYWTFRAQAFCLKAGTYERPGGRGYLSGVLVGKVAPYVQAIRASAYAHPEVDQRNIQELLWGLVAGLDLNDMTEGARAAARVLLSPDQYGALVDDLGWVPPQLSAQAIARLPPAVQTALNARDRLRTIAGRPGTTYADLERIAVLPGDPPRSDDGDDVPVGRWSWHPGGFHIRYSTTSYRWVDVEIIVGERLAIAHDSLGRIVEIRLPDGAYIRASYRDDVAPYTWSEAPGRAAYAFASVEIGSPDPDGGPMRIARAENRGFAWGPDRRRGQAAARRQSHRALDAGILLAPAGVRGRSSTGVRYAAYAPDESFGLAVAAVRSAQIPVIDVEEARARMEEVRARQEYFQARADALTRPGSDEDLDAMLDLDHYYEGAKTVVGDPEERVEWIIETHERVTRAIARATERIHELGEDGEADDDAAPEDEGGTGEPAWTPHEDTALPASPLSQMLGMVGRLFD